MCVYVCVCAWIYIHLTRPNDINHERRENIDECLFSLFLAEGYQITITMITMHLCLIESSEDIISVGENQRRQMKGNKEQRERETKEGGRTRREKTVHRFY